MGKQKVVPGFGGLRYVCEEWGPGKEVILKHLGQEV